MDLQARLGLASRPRVRPHVLKVLKKLIVNLQDRGEDVVMRKFPTTGKNPSGRILAFQIGLRSAYGLISMAVLQVIPS